MGVLLTDRHVPPTSPCDRHTKVGPRGARHYDKFHLLIGGKVVRLWQFTRATRMGNGRVNIKSLSAKSFQRRLKEAIVARGRASCAPVRRFVLTEGEHVAIELRHPFSCHWFKMSRTSLRRARSLWFLIAFVSGARHQGTRRSI